MKNISIRSTFVLTSLALIAAALLAVIETTKDERAQPHFQEKLTAANLMNDCINYLKETHFKNEISVDNINDPNDTKIIGERFSLITSGRGSLPIKLSTVNPNFAALAIEVFHELKLKKGDHVAICATGSFPALNIAVCSAAEVMGLKVSYIASVTSSSWGATNPEYTYLDIHSSLLKGGFFSNEIIASSIGANQDIGRTISPEGRDLVRAAIKRNRITFINGNSLSENIEKRMAIFKERASELGKIKAYINIGGGIASLGSATNSNELAGGVHENVKLNLFTDKIGVMFEMASKGIDLINFKNLHNLMRKYELPVDPVPLPRPGEGKLFFDLKYDLRFVYGGTVLLTLLIAGLILFDKKQNALGNEIV